MKRWLALITVVFSLTSVSACSGQAVRQSKRVLSLCESVDNWKNYHRQQVRVRAILAMGAETTVLYDPACRNGEDLTYVSYPSSPQGAKKQMDEFIAKDRRAWVIFEGIFYGPELLKIDPKLPEPIRTKLEGSTRGYGHQGVYDTMIEVSTVVEASVVPASVPR